MKNIIYIFLIGVLFLTSCTKFLDVEPRNQIEMEKLFKTEQGFKDALTGVYIQMKSPDAYGANLTQTTVEYLISNWDPVSGSKEQKLGLLNYKDMSVDTVLSTIISKEYSIIANTNAILNKLETEKAVFKTSGLYELIKGECLGIRAYVHLDILRLFGPIPMDPSNGSQLAYVTEFSKSIHSRIPYEQFKVLLLKDIRESGELLKGIDPIMDWSLNELRTPNADNGKGYRPKDEFFANRAIRMNYYAARALDARANLWFGNTEAAYAAAREVVEVKNKDTNESIKFRLGNSADFGGGDFVLRDEHIFGLYDHNMYNWYQSRYQNVTLRKGTTANTIKNIIYGNTGTDIREQSLWAITTLNATKGNVIRKYEVKAPSQVDIRTDYKQIPLIRISEMYLILSETAPFAEGIGYFLKFRTARGVNLSAPKNEQELRAEIIKEYRKEFYAEGQAFYAYKRFNVMRPAFLFLPSSAIVNYILPLPSAEDINQ